MSSPNPTPAAPSSAALPREQIGYGERFEPALIAILIAIIIACFAGVAWIWHTYQPECQVMEYTYCPTTPSSTPEHH